MTDALFTAAQLTEFVHEDVSDGEAAVAERVAWGWLKPVLNLEERPGQPDDQVFSWILELGAIAFENPTGLEEHRLGEETRKFSAERRREILTEARETTTGQAASAPQGCFPDPYRWPDPIGW